MTDLRETIQSGLQAFTEKPTREAAINLLADLGYRSDKTIAIEGSKPQGFLDLVAEHNPDDEFNKKKALYDDWQSADILFQLTDEELAGQNSLFDETNVNAGLMRSYLFFAIELTGNDYARGKLTAIARQINRVFPMPVMVFIRHGDAAGEPALSIAVINRRQHKKAADKDVLGKVTIIRNISLREPHRGHLDILDSIARPNLVHPQKRPIDNFDALHAAWEEIFNVELLNKRFYKELANWYFWAMDQVEFPDDLEKNAERRKATGLIRLLTRLIFCWFLKEKALIPERLFHPAELGDVLTNLDEGSSSFYLAILQNLFFATLNKRMGRNDNGQPHRTFALDEGFLKNKETYGVDNLLRHEKFFQDAEAAPSLFADVPFLNGGLFECLDRSDENGKKHHVDGFSRNPKKQPRVPNKLFFAEEIKGVDLSDVYGDKKRRNETVSGLIRILGRYKFTIVENTPIDQEIALDPELLGKVFENLLASYNEETQTTARKQTGSFYTPRPIVEYMVDESLKAHLKQALVDKAGMSKGDAQAGLDILFAYREKEHAFSDNEVDCLIEAIDHAKILDPACGSGAFPMGVLHKLVYILGKLDPDNEKWKQRQLARQDSPAMWDELEKNFESNDDDYGRKRYLIENCIYGVDIQPIAIQISKLRFFISLVCDQKTNDDEADNRGVQPLPNLETRFVAADTLIGVKSGPLQNENYELLVSEDVKNIQTQLQRVRHDHFSVRTRQQKEALRKKDKALREQLADALLDSDAADKESSRMLAAWNPYDPHQSADFFEPLWMFDRSLAEGFDVVLGNPPYVSVQEFARTARQANWKRDFETYAARGDIYCFFYERGAELLRPGGILTYISSNKWMRAGYGENLRAFLSSKVNTLSVLDFGMAQNFGAATTYTCIVLFEKTPASGSVKSCYATDDRAAIADPTKYFAANAVTQKNVGKDPWVVLPKARQRIKSLVEDQGIPLERWDIRINYGIRTGYNEAFYLSSEQRSALIDDHTASAKLIGPLVRGRDIERYRVNWPGEWQLLIPFGAHEYLEEDYPAVYKHLAQFEEKLKERGQCKYSRTSNSGQIEAAYPGQHHWLELDNNPSVEFLKSFQKPKIIYQDIAQSLPFYLDKNEHYYFNNTAWMLTSETECLSYLCAIFNSSLFRCAFRDNFPEYSGNAYRLFAIFVYQLAIKRPKPQESLLFSALVNLIQYSRAARDQQAASEFLESLIDACVMECYFREHMAERDLLLHEEVAAHLEGFDPNASDSDQKEYLEHFYRTLNASDSNIRNRLLRISADSPDLLAIIKEEGQV